MYILWVFIVPQATDQMQLNKPTVDKIWKHRTDEFWTTVDDDAKRVKFWLENMIRIFNELSYTPEECIKCVVSLLRDNAYH